MKLAIAIVLGCACFAIVWALQLHLALTALEDLPPEGIHINLIPFVNTWMELLLEVLGGICFLWAFVQFDKKIRS